MVTITSAVEKCLCQGMHPGELRGCGCRIMGLLGLPSKIGVERSGVVLLRDREATGRFSGTSMKSFRRCTCCSNSLRYCQLDCNSSCGQA